MRIADIDPANREADILRGRQTIDTEVGNPEKTVMIVRWTDAAVSHFVDRASARSDVFPWRSGVWVRHPDIFRPGEEQRYFGGHPTACAAILDLNDAPSEWLHADATLFAIEQAWLRTEGKE